MRKLIASTFTSLDGVMQAPGGPDEDPSENFTLGGWISAFWDEAMDLSAAGFDGKDRELVLGRKTYEIFEAYWPHQAEDNAIARTFNAARKRVASRTMKSLKWNNASVLGGDVVPAITALKGQPGHDLQIIGSGNLIQTRCRVLRQDRRARKPLGHSRQQPGRGASPAGRTSRCGRPMLNCVSNQPTRRSATG